MSDESSMENMLYGPILEENIQGLEGFEAEFFRPCQGTILVVLPPKVTEIKGIAIPDISQKTQLVGRVAAVPKVLEWSGREDSPKVEDSNCPVRPGDWVVFRPGASSPVMFDGRTDLVLLNYCEGPESDLLGFFPQGEGLQIGCKEDLEEDVSETPPGLTKDCVTSTV